VAGGRCDRAVPRPQSRPPRGCDRAPPRVFRGRAGGRPVVEQGRPIRPRLDCAT